MNYIDIACENIKKFEGLKLQWYKCPAGKDTIGYGHVIVKGESELYDGITKSKAESLLKNDVAFMAGKLSSYLKTRLNDNQLAAVLSFVYNIGPAAFKNSTMRKLINDGNLTDASAEFLKWVYVKGSVCTGLVNRRKAEQQLFNRG